MDKVDIYLVETNLHNDPSTLSGAVEEFIEKSPANRADIMDLLTNKLNEQIHKINRAKFSYLGPCTREQYQEVLDSVVEFAQEINNITEALNDLSTAVIHKIEELEKGGE